MNIVMLSEKGATQVLIVNTLLQNYRPSLYAGEFYAALDMACRYAPSALPVCGNRTDGGTGVAGSEAVWLGAGIVFSPPLCHHVPQFSHHNTFGFLSDAATVSARNADFTPCNFMVWNNGLDGGREF